MSSTYRPVSEYSSLKPIIDRLNEQDRCIQEVIEHEQHEYPCSLCLHSCAHFSFPLEWIAEFNDGQKWLVGKALVVLKNKPASETGRQARRNLTLPVVGSGPMSG